MSGRLYDHDQGQYVDVGEDEITDLVKSGRYTFPSGITIPTVGSDGKLYDLPSDQAYDAFTKSGSRWATPADKAAWEQEGQAQIVQNVYGDNTGTALAAGALRGATLGASDAAVGAFAPDLVEGLKATKELNPVASAVGNVAGTVAMGGATGVLGAAKEIGAAGEGLGALATAGLGTSRAARALQTAAPTVLGNVAEGAFFGLGEGVSEAALGKPDDVATNLIAGTGLGAITGGAFGAALGGVKAAKPFLNEAADAVTGGASRLVTGAARNLAERNVVATLNKDGEQELAAYIKKSGLIDTDAGQAARELAGSGEWKKAKDLIDEAAKHESVLVKEAKQLENGTREYLKKLPKEEARVAEEALRSAGNDVVAARKQLFQDFTQADGMIRDQIRTLDGPAVFGDEIAKDLEAFALRAKKSGDKTAISKAETTIDAIKRNLGSGITEGAEINGLRNVKDAMDYSTIGDILNKDARQAFIDLSSKIKNTLENHPREFVADSFKSSNQIYEAMSKLGEAVGKNAPKMSAIRALMSNPEKNAQTMSFIGKLEEFAPELSKFEGAVKGSKAAKDAFDAIRAKMVDGQIASPNGKLSMDEMSGLIKEFGLTKGNISQRLDRAATLRQTLGSLEGKTDLEKAIILERAAKGGPSILEKYLPSEKALTASDRLFGMKGDDAAGLRKQVAGYAVGAVMGPKMGAAAAALAGGRPSIASTLKILNQVERASYKGAQLLNKSMRGAVDALTSDTIIKASRIGSGPVIDRDRFNAVKKQVATLSSPSALQAHAESMNATVAPQIHGAIVAKMSVAANYLQQTMPKDPLASYTLNPDKSTFTPSDAEVSKYMRRVETVNNPISTVERIAQGTVTPEEMDALKTVHPEIYGRLQSELINGIMSSEKTIPYSKRVTLKQVFGIPTDYSLQPTFIASMQQIHNPPDEGGRPNEGANGSSARESSRKPIDVKPMNYMTDAQKNEQPH